MKYKLRNKQDIIVSDKIVNKIDSKQDQINKINSKQDKIARGTQYWKEVWRE